MSVHLVTGYASKGHVTASDMGVYNSGLVGKGKYVLRTGNMFAAETISNNLIRIKDGDLINQGRHINIALNDYEEITIDNGLQSVKRNDLIAIRYTKSPETGVEKAEVVVIKGTSAETAVDPEYITGDILAGDTTDDFPLYRVCLDGLNITAVEPLFSTIMPIKDIIDLVSSLNTNKSHIGMIIQSTTLDTMDKVIAIYGGTTWKKIEGRFLLGQSSSYEINSTGGAANVTLSLAQIPSHTHSIGAHAHGLNSHKHSIPALSGTALSNGAHSHGISLSQGGTQTPANNAGADGGTRFTKTGIIGESGAHTHDVTTSASTSGAASGNTANSAAFNSGTAGSGNSHNNMPPYKAVYIWERTA